MNRHNRSITSRASSPLAHGIKWALFEKRHITIKRIMSCPDCVVRKSAAKWKRFEWLKLHCMWPLPHSA